MADGSVRYCTTSSAALQTPGEKERERWQSKVAPPHTSREIGLMHKLLLVQAQKQRHHYRHTYTYTYIRT